VYNAPLLRNMTNRQVPLQIIPPSVETGLGLSRAAFVDAAILMGTDFVRRLGGVGPSTAWRLMNTYGSIERMLEQESKFRPPDVAEYLEQVRDDHHMPSAMRSTFRHAG
jgi:flap endonuclease-1